MSDYTSNLTLPQAAARINEASSILITTHAKPDGDAFGSVVALLQALRLDGKDARGWFMGPVPTNFRDLRGAGLVEDFNDASSLNGIDLLVILDTGALAQLTPMKRLLEAHLDRTLIIDHHLSGDVSAAWKYIDGEAAACCQIVAQLLDELSGGKMKYWDKTICDALFVGVASDTGWFKFSNTRPQTHELAARLLRCGVDHSALFGLIEQNERPQKLALLIRALDSLQLVADGKVALMVLKPEDFIQTGAVMEETERFVDIPQSVSTVQVVVLVTEPAPPSPLPEADSGTSAPPARRAEDKFPTAIRMSFRSKPGDGAVNVAELAQQFGGGGHARAAGAEVVAPLDEVVAQVVSAATSAVQSN